MLSDTFVINLVKLINELIIFKIKPVSFMGRTTYIVVLISLFIVISNQMKPCQDIEIQSYKFSLSGLPSQQRTTIVGSDYVAISYCTVMTYNNSDASQQSGFVLVKKNGTWITYTSSQTGPLSQNYALIDSTEPKKGLTIKYVPGYSSQKTFKNSSITINNQTLNYVETTETIYLTRASVRIFCNSAQQKQPSCSKTEQFNSLQSINYTYKVLNYESEVLCDVYEAQGCPTLAINSFWEFLNARSIIFAIALWTCAAFLLILGYLAIRVTILLYGIFTGSFFGVVFLAENYTDFYLQSNGIFIFTICLSVGLGILFGIALLTMPKLGYINIGVIVAALFSLLLQNSVLFLTGSLLAFYITFGVTALLMTIIALLELRYFIIICTSFTGAFLFVRPLGFFLAGYPNELISGRNFKISVKTPWQFYLYLASILVLTGIGIAIQRCINKRVGRNKGSSGHYYLEDDGPVRDKLKKIFEFKQIKQMIKSGKKQFVQLKNMIAQDKNAVKFSEAEEDDDEHGHYIEMEKMEKLQNKEKQTTKQKQKAKISFIAPKSKNSLDSRKSEQLDEVEISNDLDDARDSDKPKQRGGKKK